MATRQKKAEDGGVVGRLAGRGEEAVSRLMDELGANPRVSDALSRAMSAKGKLDSASRTALTQVGLAAADELKDLRRQIERLEQRLAKLEGSASGARKPTARRSTSKKTPSAKRATSRTSKKAEETTSPAAGRALGGGTARGGKPGGGTS